MQTEAHAEEIRRRRPHREVPENGHFWTRVRGGFGPGMMQTRPLPQRRPHHCCSKTATLAVRTGVERRQGVGADQRTRSEMGGVALGVAFLLRPGKAEAVVARLRLLQSDPIAVRIARTPKQEVLRT